MLRSLYSGITGMKVNQTKLDVIGNNIANVGTTAFKASRARFQDMLNQNAKDAMAPAVNQGGINASQIGMGVQLAGIDTIDSQGMMQPTSRNLDVAVDGEGYFMVGKGPTVFDASTLNVTNDSNSTSNHSVDMQNVMETMYTRDGAFTLDHDGNLLTSDGYRVLGYSLTNGTALNPQYQSVNNDGTIGFVDATKNLSVVQGAANKDSLRTLRIPDVVYKMDTNPPTPVSVRNFTIDKDGVISAVLDTGEVAALGQIAMAGFKNPAGLNKLGKNLYNESVNSGNPTIKTGVGETANSNAKGYGDILQGMLEMSNVDLAEQFTEMIVTSRAFQANGKTITTGDDILQDILNLKR